MKTTRRAGLLNLNAATRALETLGRMGLAMGLALAGLVALDISPRAVARDSYSFNLMRSLGAADCLPDARGEVSLRSHGPESQVMQVRVSGLPPRTTFTVFVLQLPRQPFGMAWYQGDVQTDDDGIGSARFIGIFGDETFMVAPGSGPAPIVHANDGGVNPVSPPIHMFHLGMWFDSFEDAVAAGCSAGHTPFNGEHSAGIQVLNTTNFSDDDGPLGQFAP
jgi:hypothetical protein